MMISIQHVYVLSFLLKNAIFKTLINTMNISKYTFPIR